MVLRNKIISFFIFISVLCVANCSHNQSFDELLCEIEHFFDIPPEDKFATPNKDTSKAEFKPVPIDKVLKKPEPKKPVVKVPVIEKPVEQPVAPEPIIEPEILEKTEPETPLKPQPKTQPKTDDNACNQELFLPQKNISNLYKIYLKENKSCTLINNKAVTKHFVMVLIDNYSAQDVRLLNVDAEFMKLYTNAIQNADITHRVSLNKQILNHGCHLLNQEACIAIKKSLY